MTAGTEHEDDADDNRGERNLFQKGGDRFLHGWNVLVGWFRACIAWFYSAVFYQEYAGSFAGGESLHLQQLAEKFFQRGRMFFGVSLVLLVACFVCVGLGIVTFLFPSYWTDVDATNNRLKEIKETVAKNVEEQRQIEKQAKFDGEFKDALAPLRSFYDRTQTTLAAYARDPTSVVPYEPPSSFNKVLMPYLRALQSGAESHKLEFLADRFADDGPQVVGEDVLSKVREMIALHQTPVNDLVNDLNQLKRAEDDDAVRVQMDHLKKLSSQMSWIVDEYNAASSRLRLSVETQREFIDKKFDLQSENSMLGLEGAKLITEQVLEEQRSAWERWLPILSIRVGVVILFLFLTRILLETYRYTTALSAFYRARGDALQMLGEGTKEAPLNSEEYAKLLIALAPENYRIDKIDSPENNLLMLLRPDTAVFAKKESQG